MSHKASILLRDIPRPLRDLFKAACSRRGSNMTREITEFMKRYVKDDGRLRPPRNHVVTGKPKGPQTQKKK